MEWESFEKTPASKGREVERRVSAGSLGPEGWGLARKQDNQKSVRQEFSFKKKEVADFNKRVKMLYF